MAEVNIIIRAIDKASAVMGGIKTSVGGITDAINAHRDGIMKVGAVATGVLGSLVAIGVSTSKAAGEAQTAQLQLEHAVKNVTHATEDQLQATMKLADELERKGVLDGDNIKIGLAQLSTFGLSNEAVRGLGGSLADLAVNQFGVNASGEQMSETANMIAKALNGQFGVLEKSGIRFTEAQKHAIEFGTEMEKVKAINEGFAQNLKYTNEVALKGMEGQMAKLKVQFGNVQEAIGSVFIPIITKLAEIATPIIAQIAAWASENQKLVGVIIIVTGALAALVAGASGLALILPTIIAGIGMISWPIVAVVGAISLLTAAFATNFLGINDAVSSLYQSIQAIFGPQLSAIWESFKGAMSEVFTFAKTIIDTFKMAWQENFFGIQQIVQVVWEVIKNVTTTYLSGILDVIQGVIGVISGVFKTFTAFMQGDWEGMWNAIKGIGESIMQIIGGIFQTQFAVWIGFFQTFWSSIKSGFSSAFEAVKSVVSNIMQAILSTIESTINSAIAIINKMIAAVNAVSGKVGITLPSIQPVSIAGKRATGGSVGGNQAYIVGENGPEYFFPGRSGTILNQRQADASGISSGGITINFGGVTVTNEADENRLVEKIKSALIRESELYRKNIA